jgi:hypothetical protein
MFQRDSLRIFYSLWCSTKRALSKRYVHNNNNNRWAKLWLASTSDDFIIWLFYDRCSQRRSEKVTQLKCPHPHTFCVSITNDANVRHLTNYKMRSFKIISCRHNHITRQIRPHKSRTEEYESRREGINLLGYSLLVKAWLLLLNCYRNSRITGIPSTHSNWDSPSLTTLLVGPFQVKNYLIM